MTAGPRYADLPVEHRDLVVGVRVGPVVEHQVVAAEVAVADRDRRLGDARVRSRSSNVVLRPLAERERAVGADASPMRSTKSGQASRYCWPAARLIGSSRRGIQSSASSTGEPHQVPWRRARARSALGRPGAGDAGDLADHRAVAEVLEQHPEGAVVGVDVVPVAVGRAHRHLVGELLVEAALPLVEVEVVADGAVLRVLRRDLEDHRARRAGGLAVVAQLEPGELADDADALADRVVLDLGDASSPT